MVRKIFFVVCLWLVATSLPAFADAFFLTDGGSVTGDVLRSDESGVTFHLPDDTYTNVAWPRLSQDSLKHLADDPKMKSFAEPFIAPVGSSAKEIKINPVTRLARPEHPSVFAGFFGSSVGLFILFILYGANLFAAYEIAIVKVRSPLQVMGAAAVLPIVGPVIFLCLPMQVQVSAEQKEAEALATEVAAAQQQEKIQIGEASWKTDEASVAAAAAQKKAEPQIFPRGKFTFNKRFIETRFGDFVNGGDQAKKFSMELRSMKAQMAVERIAQIGQNDLIVETPQGQVSVPFTEIQEIKLNPRNA